MGNEQSSSVRHELNLDQLTEEQLAFCGFRVLGIQEKSPASQAGFVSFFDFIVEANGIRLDTKDSTFMELIVQSEGKKMLLKVYNIKSRSQREVELTPTAKWPGKGLLGVTIRFDSYEHAEDELLHVLRVEKNSPAAQAGIQTNDDYLLGTPERVFRDPEDLYEVIQLNFERPFQCYVYSVPEDKVRIVTIIPNDKWGEDGILGAEVAHGLLHRLPSTCRSTPGASVGYISLENGTTVVTDAFRKPSLKNKNSSDDLPSKTTTTQEEVKPRVPSAEDHDEVVESGSCAKEEVIVNAPAPLSASISSPSTGTVVMEPVSSVLATEIKESRPEDDCTVPTAGSSSNDSSRIKQNTIQVEQKSAEHYVPRMDLNGFPMSFVEAPADPQ